MQSRGLFIIAFLLSSVPAAVQAGNGSRCDDLWDSLSLAAEDDGCRRSDDCASIDLPEPFGCGLPVSRAAALEAGDILDQYQRVCEPLCYNCFEPRRSLRCERGRCIAKLQHGGPRFPSVMERNSKARHLR